MMRQCMAWGLTDAAVNLSNKHDFQKRASWHCLAMTSPTMAMSNPGMSADNLSVRLLWSNPYA